MLIQDSVRARDARPAKTCGTRTSDVSQSNILTVLTFLNSLQFFVHGCLCMYVVPKISVVCVIIPVIP